MGGGGGAEPAKRVVSNMAQTLLSLYFFVVGALLRTKFTKFYKTNYDVGINSSTQRRSQDLGQGGAEKIS